eukprot:gene31103-41435_t
MRFYKELVYLPRDNDELRNTMSDYSRMGIPATLTNICTGKEGYPTLAWQATVNHKMRFLSVTHSFYDGELEELKGLYLICDGGFVKYRLLICGLKFYSCSEEAYWSSQMESTRKDVERAFGILKARFRCLKLPCLFHKQADIDNMFWTCVIFHNIILTFDGRDHLWEQDIDWNVEGQHDLEDDEWNLEKLNVIQRRALHKLTDYGLVGRRHFITPVPEESEPEFYQLRNKLIAHYYYKWTHCRNEIEWLN